MHRKEYLLEVYAERYEELQIYAYTVILSHALAEEVVQDLGIKIISNPEQFASATNLIAYYKTCISNAAKTLRKRESKFIPLTSENTAYRKREAAFETCIDHELSIDLERILSSYTEDEIHLLELLYIYGYRVKEIAEMKGVTANAISQQIFRIRMKLQRDLKKEKILFMIMLLYLSQRAV